MKPPAFSYHRPESVPEALAALAAPAHLVDVNWLDELDEVAVDDRSVRVGALARHARVEHDPAAELPAVLVLLGGTMELASAGDGARRVAAADFFLGPLESALRPGELATAVTFPRPPAGSGGTCRAGPS